MAIWSSAYLNVMKMCLCSPYTPCIKISMSLAPPLVLHCWSVAVSGYLSFALFPFFLDIILATVLSFVFFARWPDLKLAYRFRLEHLEASSIVEGRSPIV